MKIPKSLLIAASSALLVLGAAAGAQGFRTLEDVQQHAARTSADAAPAETTPYSETFLEGMARPTGESVEALAARNRIVLRGLGPHNDALEVTTRADGSVCPSFHGGGSCAVIDTLPGHTWWATSRMLPNDPWAVWGYAAPDVASIDVQAAGQIHSSATTNGGFYVELPKGVGESDVTALIVHRTDGSETTVEAPWNS